MSQDHVKQAKLGEASLRWDGKYGESEGIKRVLEENDLLKERLELKEAHCTRQAQRINEQLHQIRDLQAELTKEREARWEYEKGMDFALYNSSELARVLKWYADEMVWNQGKWIHQNTVFVTQAAEDGGTRARAILKDYLATLEGNEPNEA